MKYAEYFPTARQHVTAVPPLNESYIEAYKLLQKLSKITGSNFVSTKSFLDRNTGKLRANLIEGFHYNEWGVRLLAKEIKKSLYSLANRENGHLSQLLKSVQGDHAPSTQDNASSFSANGIDEIHGA